MLTNLTESTKWSTFPEAKKYSILMSKMALSLVPAQEAAPLVWTRGKHAGQCRNMLLSLCMPEGQLTRAQRLSPPRWKSLWAVKADPPRACKPGDAAQACPALPDVLPDTRTTVERAAVCALRRPSLSLLFFSFDLDNKQLSLRGWNIWTEGVKNKGWGRGIKNQLQILLRYKSVSSVQAGRRSSIT